MTLTFLLSLIFLFPAPVQAQASPITIVDAPVRLIPALVPICGCESAGSPTAPPTQYDAAGDVLHGASHYPDTGMCQLNASVWQDTALQHGWDIYTPDGNIRMANWLYAKSGTQPWLSSKACWAQ